jgi:hypothetical protein
MRYLQAVATILCVLLLVLAAAPSSAQNEDWKANIKATDRIEIVVPAEIQIAGKSIKMRSTTDEAFRAEFYKVAELYNNDSKRFGEDSAKVLQGIFKNGGEAAKSALNSDPIFSRSVVIACMCLGRNMKFEANELEQLQAAFVSRIAKVNDPAAKRFLAVLYASIYAESESNK